MTADQQELDSADRVTFRAPDFWVQAVAALGISFEAASFLAVSPLLHLLDRGHHHPVLVLPGFMGDDSSTLALRSLIRSWGHRVYGWGGGSNPGPTPEVLAALERRVADIVAKEGEKVSLVGWSAGGRYARYLARQQPDSVRQAVTLACPLQYRVGHDRSSISFLSDRLQHRFAAGFGVRREHEHGPLPVPSTSIYTRTDGVVDWAACLDVVDDRHENIEVYATHGGFGFNPSAYFVIADRLGQPEHDWRPFQPPTAFQMMFPRPANWGDQG
jgi:pimeloyl-ACP methyl ester carboxylesterase